jgi:hypothetical protein
MTKLGFTLAGADHPIIPVMLGDARWRRRWRKDAGARHLRHRLFVPRRAERPGPHPNPDVRSAFFRGH